MIEAYIIERRVKTTEKIKNGVGSSGGLSDIFVPVYESPFESNYINVSGLITGINGFHKSVDENTFSIFESSDLSVTLSLLREDNRDVSSIEKTDPTAFYKKLLNNSLYVRIQKLAHRTGVNKFIRWDFSIYFSDTKIAFYGEIDLTSINIDESNGNCNFTVYDSMKSLEKIPAFGITQKIEYTPYYTANSRETYKWFTGYQPEEAFDLLESQSRTLANEFIDNNIHTGDLLNYRGWCLSFFNNSDIEDSISTGSKVENIRFDGEKIFINSGIDDIIYNFNRDFIWGITDTLDTSEFINFSTWELATPVNDTPPTEDPTGLMGVLSNITDLDWDEVSDVFYDPSERYVYYIKINYHTTGLWGIFRRKWNGWSAGAPDWGTESFIDSELIPRGRGGDNWGAPITVTDSGDIFFSTFNCIYRYNGSFEQILTNDDRDEGYFSRLIYLRNNHLIIVAVYREKYSTQNEDFVKLIIIDSLTGDIKDILTDNITTDETFDNYDLSYSDFDWENDGTMFEIQLEEIGSDSLMYIAALTNKKFGTEKILAILTPDLKKCIMYTNLTNSLGNYATRASITRVLEDVDFETPDGTIVTRQYNAIYGYIGGGSIADGNFFKYSMTHTGNIRSLNFDKMSLAEAYSEIAKFSGSYFFIDHVIQLIDGKQIARPQVNIIGRRNGRDEFRTFLLDRLWSSWSWKAQYKNYMGIITCKYNGGETQAGASAMILSGFDEDGERVMPDGTTLTEVYGMPNKDIEFKLIFDQNLAKWRGNEYLYFYWDAKQVWTINTDIDNFRLVDLVRLRYSDGGVYDRIAQIISIDFDITERKATIRAITVTQDLVPPPNPLLQTELLTNQLTQPDWGNL